MKIELKIRIDIADSFEQRMFNDDKGMFSPKFRNDFLSYLGFLMDVKEEEEAKIDSFVIKKLPQDCEPDPDIKNDITGQAI
jgi:hypothetical protein